MLSKIVALLCVTALASVTDSDVQKMNFLQEIRTSAKEELEIIEAKEANEQANLAIEFNMACMERAQQAKKLEELKITSALREAAIAEQGARYLHHMNDVDTSAFFVSEVSESDQVQQLDEKINLELNIGSNDGFAKPYANIFTKTAIPATWDKDYYDVSLPYNLTYADIGGIAIDVESIKDTYRYTADKYKDRYVGSRIQQEFLHLPISVAKKNREIVTDVSGVETYAWKGKHLYGIALPRELFPEALVQQGFYPFSMFKNTGVLADLILTNGTIINCVVIDGIGTGHSNGVCNGWTASSVDTAQDGVRYYLNEMKLPQYAKFFHAASCHTVELSGSVNTFREYYGFNDDVRISYIRIYKYSLLEE